MSVLFRRAVPTDLPKVRRITRDAYLRAGHFPADHPYMSVLENVEHRAEQAQVWVAVSAGKVVAAVMLTFAGQPYSEIAKYGELEFRGKLTTAKEKQLNEVIPGWRQGRPRRGANSRTVPG